MTPNLLQYNNIPERFNPIRLWFIFTQDNVMKAGRQYSRTH